MGKVFTGIFRTISSVVNSIFKAISEVVKSVFNVIKNVVSGIFNFIFNSSVGMFISVAFLLLPQGSLWSIGKFLFHIERFLPIPIETRLALQLKTLSLFGKLQGWQTAIWFKIGSITSTFYKIYKLHEIKFKLYLWEIENRINEVLGFNVGQLFGKIYNKLKTGAEYLEKLVMLGRINEAVRKKQYFKAFYMAIDYVDERYSKEIEKTIVYIKSLIDGVNREIAKVINFTNSILYDLQTRAFYIERVLKEIGRAFGIEEFEKLGDTIHKVITENIRGLREETYYALHKLQRFILSKTQAVYQAYLFIHRWKDFKKEERAILSVWYFNPFLKVENKIPLYLYIPRPIKGRLAYGG